jgi:hypothetical protein
MLAVDVNYMVARTQGKYFGAASFPQWNPVPMVCSTGYAFDAHSLSCHANNESLTDE